MKGGKEFAEEYLAAIRAKVDENRRKADRKIFGTMLLGLAIFVTVIVVGFLII